MEILKTQKLSHKNCCFRSGSGQIYEGEMHKNHNSNVINEIILIKTLAYNKTQHMLFRL